MRYALIGCGNISKRHIESAISNNLQIVALCDLLIDRTLNVINKFEIEEKSSVKQYIDYKEMLYENEIDLISIATESGTHAEIALYCIGRGVNVIIEKPMTLNVKDADKIIDMAVKHQVKISACHQYRFNDAVQLMRTAMNCGRFGKISHGSIQARWYRGKEYYNRGKWKGTWEQDGGTLMNQCIHGIDMLRWMMGDDIDEVYGSIRQQFHNYIEGEDLGMAIIKFKNGSIATIEGTTNTFPTAEDTSLYINGEYGTVKIGGLMTNRIDVWQFNKETIEDKTIILEEKFSNPYGNSHPRLFADMIKAINNDTSPLVDAVAGKRAVEVVLAIYKSHLERRPIKIPLEDFSCMDMKGIFDT